MFAELMFGNLSIIVIVEDSRLGRFEGRQSTLLGHAALLALRARA